MACSDPTGYGGSVVQLIEGKPGQWTDNTSMALALAESLLEKGDLDEKDLMERSVQWWQEGC